MDFKQVMTVLSILLLTSVSVERFLEFLDRAIESLGLFSKKKKGTIAARSPKASPIEGQSDIQTMESDEELDTAEGDASTVVLLDEGPQKDRQIVIKKFILQMGGCVLGVILCASSNLGIFEMLNSPLGSGVFYDWIDYLLTGILIGTGTEPIHSLIRFLQAKKDASPPREPTSEFIPVQPEIESPDTEMAQPLIDIDYHGGINPERNADRVRQQPPDMIVYHHTGMHSDSTFMEVVKVFEARGFRTGFHCVITADGHYYNYCRWDACGIHTKGYNDRSLGIAFTGCFESDPKIPGSNINGEMGNLAPTTQQLLTGAKVVALWSLLYEIDISKKDKLLPHKALTPTACPGSNFPYARFHELVNEFVEKWRKSSKAMSEIEDFKKKRYV